MTTIVKCTKCQTIYAPPTWSKLYEVSTNWKSTRPGNAIFMASMEEPVTGFIHCPSCFLKNVERPVDVKVQHPEEWEPEVFIEHEKLPDLEFEIAVKAFCSMIDKL